MALYFDYSKRELVHQFDYEMMLYNKLIKNPGARAALDDKYGFDINSWGFYVMHSKRRELYRVFWKDSKKDIESLFLDPEKMPRSANPKVKDLISELFKILPKPVVA